MEHVNVKDTEIPALGFGTWELSTREAEEGTRHALELGYRHIDTAQMYQNEEGVGRGIRESRVSREEVFLTTKVWFDELTPDQVRQNIEERLRLLDTEYVDLLLIHWPNPRVELEQTLRTFFELQEEGKIRYPGVANFPPDLMEEALEEGPLLTDQVEYHPYLDQPTLREMAVERDFMLTAYSPLAHGRAVNDQTLQQIGSDHGKTPSQVALRWLIQQRNVSAIPRSSDPEHREENFDIWDFELSDEQMQRVWDLDRNGRMIDPAFAPDWER